MHEDFRRPWSMAWRDLTLMERVDRVIAFIVCPILIVIAVPCIFVVRCYWSIKDRLISER